MTLLEVIFVAIVVLIILAIVMTIPRPGPRPRALALSLKDKTMMMQVHKSTLAFAQENSGRFPAPGLMSSTSADHDYSVNHSAPFYSYMIAMNLINADLLVSPVEVNKSVRVKSDYNYDAYTPLAGSYWDPTFQVRIDDPKIGSNASYAHMSDCGDPRGTGNVGWSHSMQTMFAVFGTRGPRDGATSGPEYDRSPTLRFMGPKNQWMGNIVFNDNHVETLNSFIVNRKDDNGNPFDDNFFKLDRPDPRGNRLAADSFLGIFKASTEFTVDPIYDPLD